MSFGLPLFLIATLAGIIPVLIHMINRQKAVVMPFSTLRFLRVSVQRTRHRKRLHDLLLLIVRVAVLVLVAVGLSRPAISKLESFFSRANTAVVIVLDNSVSMGTQVPGQTRYDGAISAVEQLLGRLRDGDAVALLPTGGPRSPAQERLYHQQEVVRQALAECRISGERADFASRLRRAYELLEADDAPNKEIYVISDMQAAGWEGVQPPTDKQHESATQIPIVLIDVHQADVPNVAIRSVELQSVAPVAGLPLPMQVEVFNAASVAQQKHLELLIDGVRESISPALSLDPLGVARHRFQVVLRRAGVHRGEVRIVGSDAVTADDQRTFGLVVDPKVKVAVIKSRGHEVASLDESFYLEQALGIDPSDGWAIHTTTLAPDALASEPLSDYAVIFCVNVPGPELGAAGRLHDYVVGGGHVVWICGSNVVPAEYNDLQQRLNGELLPAALESVQLPSAEQPDGWNINWIDAEHPALKGLDEPASLYQSVLVYKHLRFADQQTSSARVLARLSNGEPLLIERSVGAGAVLMLGTGAHIDWTNLPIRPLFLPLIARLTFHFAGASPDRSQLVAGTEWLIPLEGEQQSVEAEITRPDGQTLRVSSEGERSQTIRIAETHDIGIYRLRTLTAARSRELILAVNPDPLESAPERLTNADLRQKFGNRPVEICSDLEQLGATMQRVREGHSLWELFLGLVLAGLVFETLIANRLSTAPEGR